MEIDPDHRGVVDDAVLEFVERRRNQPSPKTFDDGVPLRLYRYGVYDKMTDAIDLMKRHGYEIARYFTDNLRDLSLPIDDCPLDPALVARPWSPEVEADALIVHNEAFADHWGSQPIEPHIWASFNAGEFFEPDTSWVAYDGAVPVSYVMSAKYPHDFADRGRTEAWIEGVGTLRSHRGRGIASALITMAIRGFRDQGLQFARLGVDSENPTGANAIYERLGFFPEERTMTFTKPVELSSGHPGAGLAHSRSGSAPAALAARAPAGLVRPGLPQLRAGRTEPEAVSLSAARGARGPVRDSVAEGEDVSRPLQR